MQFRHPTVTQQKMSAERIAEFSHKKNVMSFSKHLVKCAQVEKQLDKMTFCEKPISVLKRPTIVVLFFTARYLKSTFSTMLIF